MIRLLLGIIIAALILVLIGGVLEMTSIYDWLEQRIQP